VADGNFKADHVRQPRSQDDVWFSEGAGMMPTRQDYEEFLKCVEDIRTVSACMASYMASYGVPDICFIYTESAMPKHIPCN
jgi:hypothetical protein